MLMTNLFGDTFFDDLFNDNFRTAFPAPKQIGVAAMKTDVKETKDGYELEMELPGFTKDEVTAELKDGYLTIKAETNRNEDEKSEDGSKYIRKERYFGSTQRSFYVGENLTEEDIKAKFENGILKIALPKNESLPEKETKKLIAIEG